MNIFYRSYYHFQSFNFSSRYLHHFFTAEHPISLFKHNKEKNYMLYKPEWKEGPYTIFLHFKNYYYQLSFLPENLEIKIFYLSPRVNHAKWQKALTSQKLEAVPSFISSSSHLEYFYHYTLLTHEVYNLNKSIESFLLSNNSYLQETPKEKIILLKFLKEVMDEEFFPKISKKAKAPAKNLANYHDTLEDF